MRAVRPAVRREAEEDWVAQSVQWVLCRRNEGLICFAKPSTLR